VFDCRVVGAVKVDVQRDGKDVAVKASVCVFPSTLVDEVVLPG
jgi:hypothetical protein